MLAIVTFVPQEAGPLLQRFTGRQRIAGVGRPIFSGNLAGIPATLVIAGVGAANAVRALEALRGKTTLEAIAICGVAGALDPDLRIGDVVLVSEARDPAGTAPLRPRSVPLPSGLAGVRHAAVISVNHVLITPEQKRPHAAAGVAVDMETAALAAKATELGLPWCALRAISDAAGDALPLDFNRCLAPGGDIPLAAVLRELARRPAALPGMIRLGRATSRAARRLAEVAVAFLPDWYRSLALPGGSNGARR